MSVRNLFDDPATVHPLTTSRVEVEKSETFSLGNVNAGAISTTRSFSTTS